MKHGESTGRSARISYKRVAFFLAVSVLFHLGLLFIIRAQPVVVPLRTIEVELLKSPAVPAVHDSVSSSRVSPARQPSKSSKSRQAVEAASSAAHLLKSASKLTPKFFPSFVPSVSTSLSGSVDVAPVTKAGELPPDDPTSPWGSGGGDFARVADLGRFARFYDYVDGQVMYPGVLAYHGIEGTVNARLVVTPSGECDWHRTQISSTQQHLRVYILDVLKHVCTRDLSKYARRDANANFDLSFKFAITEHDDKLLIAGEKKVVGNVFLFYRNSQQSVAEWHIGPFRGMFPVPYVALDFAWLQENYERILYSRDPLHEFKTHVSGDGPNG